MFTGIVEEVGVVKQVVQSNRNLDIIVECTFVNELKVDQSIAHNGVCLTVVEIGNGFYTVTAIEETLDRTNFGQLQSKSLINLERCLKLGDRLDGHLVQGHIDETAIVKSILEKEGSWVFQFEYDLDSKNITVEKGSICVNGVSLTVVDSGVCDFSIAIIPYTYEHTSFCALNVGDQVNLEFDIIGKYAAKMMARLH